VNNPNWPFGTSDSTRVPIQGSLRLRLGYACDRFLPYITGGLALANVRTRFEDTGGREDKKSEVLPGFTIGTGLEYAFTDRWSARIEYRYSYFDRITTVTAHTDFGFEEHERISDHTARVAVSYRF